MGKVVSLISGKEDPSCFLYVHAWLMIIKLAAKGALLVRSTIHFCLPNRINLNSLCNKNFLVG